MRFKISLAFILIFMFGCSRDKNPETPNDNNRITIEQKTLLQELQMEILQWAVICEANGVSYLCEEGSDGDSLLFMGLSCLAGQEDQCMAIPHILDIDGRPWRAPSKISWPKGNFSRDMLLGLFAYWIKHPEATSSIQSVVHFVKNNKYSLCDAVDDRCDMNPYVYRTFWSLWGKIYEHMGLTLIWEMQQADLGDDTLLVLGSNIMPVGFNLHLIAVELYLRRALNTWSSKIQLGADKLATRQKENPFFEYIAHGSTKYAAELTLRYCPSLKPDKAHQWFIQRDMNEEAYKNSMGWDCIFLIGLLIN